MRGDGRVFRRKKNGIERGPWWISYPGPKPGGAWGEIRESTDTTDKQKAERILSSRRAAVEAEQHGGDIFVRSRRVLVNELLDDLGTALRGKAYARTAESLAKNLRRHLGQRDARRVNRIAVKQYEQDRLAEGAAPATIDKETALLVQAFSIGHDSRKVSAVPKRENLLPLHGNARQASIDTPKLRELLEEIRKADPDFADWCEWFSCTGMRNREISTLSWEDLREGSEYETLTVRVENAKIRKARPVPIVGPLEAIIERRKARKRIGCPLVFHSGGRSFEHKAGGLPERFLRAWHRAALKVGFSSLPVADEKRKARRASTLRPYDLRRYAAQNLRDAGVPEAAAIEIMGQATASMFRRYANLQNTDSHAEAFVAVGEFVAARRARKSKLVVGNFDGGARA